MGVRCIVGENTGLRIFCERNPAPFASERLGFLFMEDSKNAHNVFCPQFRFRPSEGKLPANVFYASSASSDQRAYFSSSWAEISL